MGDPERIDPIRASAGTLAIEGGRPVRSEPLPGPYPGALLIADEEERQVLDVLRSRSLFRYYGPGVIGKVSDFERRFARRMGVPHALAVSSGTAALKCALFAAGVGPGARVLVPAYSYVATVDVVLSLGAEPLFVEIDESMTMDPDDLARKIGEPGVRAVTPVHLFGVAAELGPILALARAAGVAVVEDCAQACGATYHGAPVGTLGDLGIHSFQLNKIITAGEGGAVVTRDARLFDRAVRLHDHGNHRDDEATGHPLVGEGFRMSELSGAVLLAQLARLEEILARLRAAKRYLVAALAPLRGIRLPRLPDPQGDSGACLTFLVDDAAWFVEALRGEGIRALRQYGGKPVYAQAAVRSSISVAPFCPRTEDLAARCVHLGLTTTFTRRDLDDIVRAIAKVASARGA